MAIKLNGFRRKLAANGTATVANPFSIPYTVKVERKPINEQRWPIGIVPNKVPRYSAENSHPSSANVNRGVGMVTVKFFYYDLK